MLRQSIVLALLTLGFSAQTQAAPVTVLDFEGLSDLEAVTDFYNGGQGGNGSGATGPDLDIVFSPNSLASIDADAGGGGNFANEPSPDTVAIFAFTGAAATMNVLNGFDTGFSFFYSTNVAASVTVYDGLNGTGNVLATVPLTPTPPGPGDPNGGTPFSPFGTWLPVGVTFTGTAFSVDFSGALNQVGFDNVTIGSATAGGGPEIPEPASAVLFGLAAMGLGIGVHRRRKRAAA